MQTQKQYKKPLFSPNPAFIFREIKSSVSEHTWLLEVGRSAGLNSLGTLLMALSGRSTRTVLTAEKLTFCRLREYSSILQPQRGGKDKCEIKNVATHGGGDVGGDRNAATQIICSQLRCSLYASLFIWRSSNYSSLRQIWLAFSTHFLCSGAQLTEQKVRKTPQAHA